MNPNIVNLSLLDEKTAGKFRAQVKTISHVEFSDDEHPHDSSGSESSG